MRNDTRSARPPHYQADARTNAGDSVLPAERARALGTPYNSESDLKKAKTMRLSGEVEFLDDPDLKKQLLEDWPFLQPVEPVVELFRIHSGEAFFWTMDDILKEKEIERVRF